MKKTSLLTIIGCLIIGATIFVSTALAQSKIAPKDWSRLTVVSSETGNIVFFDPDNGKIYIYNSKSASCLRVRQLVTLGETLKKLKN